MVEEKPAGRLDPSLGRRLHKALTADAEELFQAIQDPSPEVLRAALKNPRLGENPTAFSPRVGSTRAGKHWWRKS